MGALARAAAHLSLVGLVHRSGMATDVMHVGCDQAHSPRASDHDRQRAFLTLLVLKRTKKANGTQACRDTPHQKASHLPSRHDLWPCKGNQGHAAGISRLHSKQRSEDCRSSASRQSHAQTGSQDLQTKRRHAQGISVTAIPR